MAPPRPSSPTSLLWAHQLKREHSYLLKRVQDLESSNKAHEDRIKTAEAAGKAVASGEIASLAKQIKDLEDIGLSKCVDAMEDDVPRKIDDVQADSEALTMQLAALQKDDLVAREEKKKSLNKDKALLNRIGEVEEGLKKYERGLELVGRKVNDQQISAIKEQLDGLTKRVMKEGSQMKLLVESIQQLEQAHDELRKANQGLEEQLRKRSDEPVERPKQAINRPSTVEDDASEGATPEVTTGRKKNHKWSGGGADRDIVKMGTTLFGDRLPKASAPKKDAAPRKAPIVPPKKPKPRKGPVPKAPLTPGVRKSHKWGGGGADRDIVAAGLSGDEGRKRKRSAEVEPEPPKSKAGKAVAGKAIVRSGRGWYEVVDSESPEQEGDSTLDKRGRHERKRYGGPSQDESQISGRPTKRRRLFPTLRSDEADLLEKGSGTRQMRTKRQTQKSIKLEEEDEEEGVSPAVPAARPGMKSARPNVFNSYGSAHSVVGGSKAKAPAINLQPEPRRTIPQDDD